MKQLIIVLVLCITYTGYSQDRIGKETPVMPLNLKNLIGLYEMTSAEVDADMQRAGAYNINYSRPEEPVYSVKIGEHAAVINKDNTAVTIIFSSQDHSISNLKSSLLKYYILTKETTKYYRVNYTRHYYIIAIKEVVDMNDEYGCTILCYKFPQSQKFN